MADLELGACFVGMYVIGTYELGDVNGFAGRWGRVTAVGVKTVASQGRADSIEIEWCCPPLPDFIEKHQNSDNGFARFIAKKALEEQRVRAGAGWFREVSELELLVLDWEK